MNKKGKIVLVLERSSANLGVAKGNSSDDVVLEGIFAQFGVLNNNNRIYEENEYLPHLEYLNKKISENRLMGECDHPEKFDVSLTKVSHIVESLVYDKDKRQLIGRVRLLDTPSGRIAKELVAAGVPISISSRAAGLVENNNKVKIKRIFTYDLVADPGFENAVLSKINESLGFTNDSNISIYDMPDDSFALSEDDNVIVENKEPKEDKTKRPENMEYVTSEELNTYSLLLKEEIEEIHNKIDALSANSELTEKLQTMDSSMTKMVNYIKYLATSLDESTEEKIVLAAKVEKLVGFSNYMATTLDEAIKFQDENIEKTEQRDNYIQYLKEQLERGVSYSEYLKDCIEKGVSYTEYTAKKVDEAIQFMDHVVIKTNAVINYAEYMGEKLNHTMSYADYLGESITKSIEYAQDGFKQVNEFAEYTEFALTEGVVIKTPDVTPIIEKTDYSTLNGKVDNILESIKKQKVEDTVKLLEESKKQKVSTAISTNSQQAADQTLNRLVENAQHVNLEERWLNEAPESFKKIWETLDSRTQMSIVAQSKFYKLETDYQIKNFWETRNISESAGLIIESANPIDMKLGYNTNYIDSVKAGLNKFRK